MPATRRSRLDHLARDVANRLDRLGRDLSTVATAHARLRTLVDDLADELPQAQQRIGVLEERATREAGWRRAAGAFPARGRRSA